MGGEWRVRKIGTFAKAKGGKRLPKSIALQTEKNNHPYIRVVDFTDGKIHQDSLLYVPNDAISAIQRYRVAANDVIISIVGTIGAIAQVPQELHGANLTENAAKLYFTEEDVDASYVAYYLKSSLGQHEITINTVGSTQSKLPLYGIENINVALPPLKEQQAIACVLGSLDDKIELNRKMNQTLEEMARAIFKSWFVDFDPVHAKATVRREHPGWTNEQISRAACPNLKPEIAELFPDSFEDSKLGEIPRGWKVRPIGDVVQILGGGTPSTKEPAYWEGSIHPFCTPKDMASLTDPVLLQTERHLTDKGLAKVSSGQLPLGTVLLSSRAPIGYLAVAETPISINQGIIAMVCDGELPNLYVLHWTKSNMDRILTNANGSTFMEISKRNFRPIAAVVPSPEVLNDFMRVVEPMHRRVVSSLKQIRQLANLRDFLLPRLISGDLVVAEGERIVGRIST